MRGLGFRERHPSTIPLAELERIDACATVVTGLSLCDTIAGLDFQARHLLYALRAGDRRRIGRALAYDIATMSAVGTSMARSIGKTVQLAETLAADLGDAFLSHVCRCSVSWSSFVLGHWDKSLEQMIAAEAAPLPAGRQWPIGNSFTSVMHGFALLLTGDLETLRVRVAETVRNARDRGDLFVEVFMSMELVPMVKLAADDPVGARAELRAAMARWPQKGFFIPHYWYMQAEMEISLYEGDGNDAYESFQSAWPFYTASELPQVEHIRIFALHALGRAALGGGPRGIATVKDCARRLGKEKAAWARPLSLMLGAGAAAAGGRKEEAAGLFRQAEAGLEQAGMKLYLAAARHARGRLTNNAAVLAEAEKYFRAQQVTDSRKLSQILAPGGQ